jgi:Domain of Unknown Function (DUF928)
MSGKKYPLNILSISLLFFLGVFSTQIARAQAPNPIHSTEISQGLGSNWNAFETENTGNAPGRRVGGATRGSCPTGQLPGQKPLTAIVPESEMGRTASAYPSIFLYVPSSPEQSKMEFELRDENENLIYRQEFLGHGQDGIYRIDIPTYVTPLQEGKNYLWSFSLICSETDLAASSVVGGWINRIENSQSIQRKIQTASPSDRPEQYTEELLWYDLMTSLADLRQSDPNNPTFQNTWTNLLNEVGLNDLATEPLN